MGNTISYSTAYLDSLAGALKATEVTDLKQCSLSLDTSLEILSKMTSKVKQSGGRFFFAGNGASAAFATHMTLDWSKNGGVPSIALHDASQLTALGNDLGYEEVFAAPLEWHGRATDLLIVISSSGNSPNVVRAIEVAREKGMAVVTFSGLRPENSSRSGGDVNFYVPARTYGIVECAHQSLLHLWLDHSMGIEEWSRETVQNMNASEFTL